MSQASERIDAHMKDAIAALQGGTKAIQARQDERLQAMVDHARKHSRLYAKLYAGLPEKVADVRRLPVVTRAQLQGNFDEWVTDPAITRKEALAHVSDKSLIGKPFKGHYLWTTSGVTGDPGLFIHSKEALYTYQGLSRARLTGAALGLEGAKRLIARGGRMAVCYATGHHFGGIGAFTAYMTEVPELFSPANIKFVPVQLPLKEIVQQLNEWDPAFIVGYTNSVIQLAKEQDAGRLHIDPVFVLTGGEWYEDEEWGRIQRTWPNAVVRDAYGATECIANAYGCAKGWLHVNADWVILEPVELDYSPTPPGQASRTTLMTNLANKLLPLIRYDIGDRITQRADPCPCGNPLPAIRVEGRRDEVLTFLSPSNEKVVIVPKALVGVIEQVTSIELYQFIQTGPREVEIRVLAVAGVDPEEAWGELRSKLQAYFERQGLAIDLRRASEAPHKDPHSGKFLHIWATKQAKEKLRSA